MRVKLGVVLLYAAFLVPAIAQAQVPAGRWEIVHTSGDSTVQTDLYPGGFSTYLNADGSANTVATAANSICVINADGYNVVPTWSSAGNDVTITITVDNMGLGPNVSFVYTGTYNAATSVPGDSSLRIPAIAGTYYATGNATACSTTTSTSPGNFVATFLPDLSSGSSTGSLDGTDTNGGTPFDASVSATVNYTTPSIVGQIAGSVSLAAIPALSHNACFASTNGTTPNDLTIDSGLSNQAGILNSIYAEGFDPNGNPTTLVLQGYSANLYITTSNTDPNANLVGTDEWAAAAAIGEDDPAAGTAGVNSDGTNTYIVQYYNVVGGACDGAGGADAPFLFLSGTPVPHHNQKNPHRHHGRRHDERSGKHADGGAPWI